MFSGYLEKMDVSNESVVVYTLSLGDKVVEVNQLLGKSIRIAFTGKIKCVGCETILTKAYGQGFCYNCLQVSPLASDCILNPEKCKAQLGISRDMTWSVDHCLKPHIVYLSYTSQVKVGVTRLSQVPIRWIDQGAIGAIQLLQLPNRHMAGLVEMFLKKVYSDKTAWHKMLVEQCIDSTIDLCFEKSKAISLLPSELQKYAVDDSRVTLINYPFFELPSKLTLLKPDSENVAEGVLTGIKGQYLIFDNAFAINIRKYTGYEVNVSF